jgi:hypothetical protein
MDELVECAVSMLHEPEIRLAQNRSEIAPRSPKAASPPSAEDGSCQGMPSGIPQETPSWTPLGAEVLRQRLKTVIVVRRSGTAEAMP